MTKYSTKWQRENKAKVRVYAKRNYERKKYGYAITPLPGQKKFYTISEVAGMIDVHADTLRNMEKEGKITPLRYGKRGDRRYTEADIEQAKQAFRKHAPKPDYTLVKWHMVLVVINLTLAITVAVAVAHFMC